MQLLELDLLAEVTAADEHGRERAERGEQPQQDRSCRPDPGPTAT